MFQLGTPASTTHRGDCLRLPPSSKQVLRRSPAHLTTREIDMRQWTNGSRSQTDLRAVSAGQGVRLICRPALSPRFKRTRA